MRGGTRSAMLAVASLTIVVAFGGCAGELVAILGDDEPSADRAGRRHDHPGDDCDAGRDRRASGLRWRRRHRPPHCSTGAPGFPIVAVRFAPGQASVGNADISALDGVVRWLEGAPGLRRGDRGTHRRSRDASENMAIGEKRAASIMRYMVSRGLDPTRVSIVSYGSAHPLCAEKTDSCRAKNRRADLLVKRH